jgi:hypothetical protein
MEKEGHNENDWFNFMNPWRQTRQNPQENWSGKHKEVADKLYPDFISDAANGIDIHGKPVFDATNPHKYVVTEKEMTDYEKISFRQYQLWKTTMKIDRRDSMYEAFATSDYTNGSAVHNWLGAPFPIIEPNPTPGELMYAVRWYEHLGAILASCTFFAYVRGKPQVRYTGAAMTPQKGLIPFAFIFMEFMNGHMASSRLMGKVENEYECMRFGVVESPARLAEKAKYWERFRKYKEEWMKRYDYYVYGMRPGERYSFLSPCHFAPASVLFNKRTDYPMRKNPFILTETTMTPAQRREASEFVGKMNPGRSPRPIDFDRPENKYYGPDGPTEVRGGGVHNKGAALGGLFT